MNAMSVYDKATQVQNHARRLAEGAAGEREADRVAQRIADVRAQLAALRQQVAVAQVLNNLELNELIDLSDVNDGRAGFERKAQPGALPSNTVFKTAEQKIKKVTERIGRETQAAWATWARERLSVLPLSRIPTLTPEEQRSARERQAELERSAAKDKITTSDIRLFTATYTHLKEVLDEADDPPDALLTLLDRLDKRPVLTLRQVTDEEIALLRQCGMDDQIGLLRKGT